MLLIAYMILGFRFYFKNLAIRANLFNTRVTDKKRRHLSGKSRAVCVVKA